LIFAPCHVAISVKSVRKDYWWYKFCYFTDNFNWTWNSPR
jgi:hypothetical protein